nr:type II toxin-antitoxin system RelE/ParE family toxin [Halomonas anticariensis]
MPGDVQDVFGFALHLAQTNGKHAQAKPLKGFGSAGVLEVVPRPSQTWTRSVNGSRSQSNTPRGKHHDRYRTRIRQRLCRSRPT